MYFIIFIIGTTLISSLELTLLDSFIYAVVVFLYFTLGEILLSLLISPIITLLVGNVPIEDLYVKRVDLGDKMAFIINILLWKFFHGYCRFIILFNMEFFDVFSRKTFK